MISLLHVDLHYFLKRVKCFEKVVLLQVKYGSSVLQLENHEKIAQLHDLIG